MALFIGSCVIPSTASNIVLEKSSETTIKNLNNPPLPPVIWTEDFSTFYISVPQDPEGDQTYYMIDWGDGTSSGWIGPFNSGEIVSISHVWSEEGGYQIKVKAKDQDEESKLAIYLLILSSSFKFFLPTLGYVGITYVFTIYYDDSIDYLYIFCWGDGTDSGWLGPGNPVIAYKSWNSPGEYTLRWKAKDMFGYETPWSDPYIITIASFGNQPPNAPRIDGPVVGRPGTYNYTFSATDPDGDNVSYYIGWGDGTYENWTDWYPSGEIVTLKHTYSKLGIYIVQAKAKDIYGLIGPVGTLPVRIPRDRMIFDLLFLKFLERFPNMLSILRQPLIR